MTGIVVGDAAPLIGLARVRYLDLLPRLYGSVFIPPAVHDELQIGSGRSGAEQLKTALDQGWLQVHTLPSDAGTSLSELVLLLDVGEAEAIVLAGQVNCRLLLIDDLRGRRIARYRGIPVAGVAGVLLAAKQRNFTDAVLPILHELAHEGYRLSATLVGEVARLAGETQEW